MRSMILNENFPVYTTDTKYSIRQTADVETLYKLIDILVRYKHLDMQPQPQGSNTAESLAMAKKSLLGEAEQCLSITETPQLYKDIEKLCVLCKTAASNSAKLDDENDRVQVIRDVREKVLSHRPQNTSDFSSTIYAIAGMDNSDLGETQFKTIVHRFCSRDSHPSVKGFRALSLLVEGNFRLLEDELRDKLNVEFKSLDGEGEKRLLSDHHHENRMNSLKKGVYYASCSIVASVITYAITVAMM